jgi:hypothetical protein
MCVSIYRTIRRMEGPPSPLEVKISERKKCIMSEGLQKVLCSLTVARETHSGDGINTSIEGED